MCPTLIVVKVTTLSFRFPATMVDRITPQTVFEHREILAKDFGIADRWPVVTEEYKQWIIEVCLLS